MKLKLLVAGVSCALAAAGCGTAGLSRPPPTASAVPPAAPSVPAPATTVLQSNCTVEASSITNKPTYTFTLTNVTSQLVNVSQATVVFNDASGTEQSSDSPFATGTITPGQSLSWTEPLPDQFWTAAENTQNGELDYTVVPIGLTCTVVQWYHP